MKYLRYVIPTLLVAAVIVLFALEHGSNATAVEKDVAVPAPMKAPPKKSTAPASFASKPPVGTHARCPVTDEEYTVSEKTTFVNYGGRLYGFCCSDCRPEFEKNPL